MLKIMGKKILTFFFAEDFCLAKPVQYFRSLGLSNESGKIYFGASTPIYFVLKMLSAAYIQTQSTHFYHGNKHNKLLWADHFHPSQSRFCIAL